MTKNKIITSLLVFTVLVSGCIGKTTYHCPPYYFNDTESEIDNRAKCYMHCVDYFAEYLSMEKLDVMARFDSNDMEIFCENGRCLCD